AATRAGARYRSLASFDSKLPAKLSKVVSMKLFDARSSAIARRNRTSAFGGRAVVQWTLLQCTGRGPERSCGAFLMRCLFPVKPCYSQSRDLGLAVSSP